MDKEESELEILNGGIYSIAAFRNKTGKVALDQQVVLAPYSLNVFLQVGDENTNDSGCIRCDTKDVIMLFICSVTAFKLLYLQAKAVK